MTSNSKPQLSRPFWLAFLRSPSYPGFPILGVFTDISHMGRASLGPSAVRTHSRCEPLAVVRHFVAGIGQQLYGLANKFFMQVRLLFENGVDI